MWCLSTGFDDRMFYRLTRLQRETFYALAKAAAG